jgi:hypothetical protein
MRKHVTWQTSENVAAIKARLQARGIDSIDISSTMHATIMASRGTEFRQPDNRHLTAAGYTPVVSSVASEVAAALGR